MFYLIIVTFQRIHHTKAVRKKKLEKRKHFKMFTRYIHTQKKKKNNCERAWSLVYLPIIACMAHQSLKIYMKLNFNFSTNQNDGRLLFRLNFFQIQNRFFFFSFYLVVSMWLNVEWQRAKIRFRLSLKFLVKWCK